METNIKYIYNNNEYNYKTYLTDETLGDLQELLLEKLNINLVLIKYIQCKYKIDNIEYIDILGVLLFNINLKDYIQLKENIIFEVLNNENNQLNYYHYQYLDYIRNRNLNDYELNNQNYNNQIIYDIIY
jgi:hypothetical protein